MTRYAIDAGTLLQIARGDASIAGEHSLVSVGSARSEALEILLGEVNRGELAEKEALALHERLTGLKVRLLGDRGSRGMAWRIARRRGWDTLHHAEYLAVAKLQADALVTTDPELAAKAEGIVPVVPLSEILAP